MIYVGEVQEPTPHTMKPGRLENVLDGRDPANTIESSGTSVLRRSYTEPHRTPGMTMIDLGVASWYRTRPTRRRTIQ